MKIWGVTQSDIARAAKSAGVTVSGLQKDGRGLRCHLTPTNGETTKFRKLKPGHLIEHPERQTWVDSKGRGYSWAICWHGHYAFMKALFDIKPEARIQSRLADYWGRQDFLDRADSTGDENIASEANPLDYRKSCDCENEVAQVLDLVKSEEIRVRELSPVNVTRHHLNEVK